MPPLQQQPRTDIRDFPVIHAITTDAILSRPDFVDRARDLMQTLGSRGAMHLRGSHTTAHIMCMLAEALAPWQDTTGAWLVVNDRVDIALAARARGVQLTPHSLTPPDVRQIAATAQIPIAVGASVHSEEEAREAARQGVHWLIAGHIFATPSHANEPPRGVSFLTAIAATTSVPIIAIGGIQPEHMPALRAAGTYGVAAIRGLWETNNAARACERYLSSYDSAPDDDPNRESGAVAHR